MSEMVERVAKALCKNACLTWSTEPDGTSEYFRGGARAAITAMRDPTPKMIAATWKALNPCGENCIEKWGTGPAVREAYQAMIDEVLK